MSNKSPLTPYEFAVEKTKAARSNLLLMIILTVVNIILSLVSSDVILLFSATVPYFSVAVGTELGFTAGGVIFALAILILYYLCWIFSKKHYGWMIGALVMFIIDTLVMAVIYLAAQDFSGILDVVVHIWVLYYLIIGVKYGSQLKNMPADIENESETQEFDTEQPATYNETAPIKSASYAEKFRILLEAEAVGHRICYRRVKRTNELVIDGYVYAEFEALVEAPHSLTAKIDNHDIEVGLDTSSHSYIKIDGEIIKQKLRLL